MKSIFDFDIIRKLIKGSDTKAPFNILIDSMNGGKNSNFNYELLTMLIVTCLIIKAVQMK